MGTVAYTSMEDLSADDDLLSDILIDSLAWGPPDERKISTHKMDPQYRSPRFESRTACEIVQRFCVEEQNLHAGVEAICQMPVVKAHLKGKSAKQIACFKGHTRRYLQCYLPDSGVEFALTMRYKQSPGAPLRSRRDKLLHRLAQETAKARDVAAWGSGKGWGVKSKGKDEAGGAGAEGSSSAAGGAAEGSGSANGASGSAALAPPHLLAQLLNEELPPLTPPGVRATNPAASALLSKADLCILAVRPFKPGDLISALKGGITDLTKEEDEALREEAAHFRAMKHGQLDGADAILERPPEPRAPAAKREPTADADAGAAAAAPAAAGAGPGDEAAEAKPKKAKAKADKRRPSGGKGKGKGKAKAEPEADASAGAAPEAAPPAADSADAPAAPADAADAAGASDAPGASAQAAQEDAERDEDDHDALLAAGLLGNGTPAAPAAGAAGAAGAAAAAAGAAASGSKGRGKAGAAAGAGDKKPLKQSFKYRGVLGAGRDFSVVRSARKGCSQLFLGPARFINHDCEPNVEFYRMDSQMTFRCIRPIAVNEEIVTYYGDDYFEVKNSECLCATCEERGTGAFKGVKSRTAALVAAAAAAAAYAAPESASAQAGSVAKQEEAAPDAHPLANGGTDMKRGLSNGSLNDTGSEAGAADVKDGALVGRRSGPKRTAAIAAATAGRLKERDFSWYSRDHPEWADVMYDKNNSSTKDGNITRKLLDEPEALQVSAGGGNTGPERECMTCGALFWSNESWWKQEECHRCERHYKIFKADWPGRVPTESLLVRSKGKKPGEGPQRLPPPTARKRGVSSESSNSSASSQSGSVVYLTPLRGSEEDEEDDTTPKPRKARGSTTTTATATTARKSSSSKRDRTPKAGKGGKRAKSGSKKRAAGGEGEGEDSDGSSGLSSIPSDFEEEADSSAATEQPRKPAPAPEAVAPPAAAAEEVAMEVDQPPQAQAAAPEAPARQSADAESESSSASDAAPKMLGKDATVEGLAKWWGAPEGDRRSRRKSVTVAVEERAAPAPASKAHYGRRVASAGQAARSAAETSRSSSRNLASPPPASPVRKKARIIESDESSDKSTRSASDERAADKRDGDYKNDSSSEESPRPTIPGLATKGAARTSESNLALAWSAGTEGGRRSRRSMNNQPTSVAIPSTTGNKRRRSSHDRSTDSSRAGSTTRVLDDKLRVRKSRSDAHLSPSIASAPLSDAGSPASSHLPSAVQDFRRRSVDFKMKDEIMGEDSGSAVADDSADGPQPGHSRSGSSTFPLPMLPVSLASANVPVAAAELPKPVKKNLRWGKGMSSSTLGGPPPPLGPGIPRLQPSPSQASLGSPDKPNVLSTLAGSAQPLASSASLQMAVARDPRDETAQPLKPQHADASTPSPAPAVPPPSASLQGQ